jgi:hypothetical protein
MLITIIDEQKQAGRPVEGRGYSRNLLRLHKAEVFERTLSFGMGPC